MKKLLFFVATIILSVISFAQKTDTLFYSVVNLGKIVGENKSWKTSANEYNYYFYYNDRGRGSVVNTTVSTNADGKVQKMQSSGLDYFKAPFSSSFQVIGDSLVSQYNTIRKTEHDSAQQYVYNENVPASTEIFVRALLAAPNRTFVTMGGDTARLQDFLPFTVNANAKKIRLYLCDIRYGNGSSPIFIWLDDSRRFFADVSGWSNTIKKNYEKLEDTLHALEEKEAISFYKNIYRQLSDSLPAKLAIKDVSLFDAANATVLAHSTVLVTNGIITATGSEKDIIIPAGYYIINGNGKTMLPGLWDTHGHYDKSEGIAYLSGGITHVRDMGNMADIKQVQQNIRLHNLTGPDLSYLSGFIDKDDEYHGPVGKLVHSKAEALQAIGAYNKAGYNQIKIYSSIDTGWVKAMCIESHRLHMRVAGHIPVHMTASKAVTDGYDEITHMNMVMLNFFPDTIDTRRNRVKPLGEHANTIDLQSPAVKEFMALLVKKKIVVEPTMSIFNGMFIDLPGDTATMYKPVTSWMPEALRKNSTVTSFIDDTSYIPAYKESYNRMMQMLKLIYDNSLTLLAGTDGGQQLALHNELRLFVKAGIPANEVLKIACYNPSKTFGLSSKYGAIQKGRIADFILVDGNPAENIGDIKKVFMVVTNRSLFYPKKLYKYSGWNYYY
jgi:hypothetical protein